MWRILARAGIYQLSYAGEQTHAAAFNEGRRDQGLQLLADLERVDPTAVYRIAQEVARESRTSSGGS